MESQTTEINQLNFRLGSEVIGDPQRAEAVAPELVEKVNHLIAAAGNAPFHYACSREHQEDLPSPVPWRVYALDGDVCRKLMEERIAAGDQTKIPNMLAAAQYLLQVTPGCQTPEPSKAMSQPRRARFLAAPLEI